MPTVKEQMVEVINSQQLDASYEEIMRELAFEGIINHGLQDSRQKRTMSNEEIERRIQSWQQ